MENKLEQLLNSLIEKGWKPFGDYDIADFNQIGNTFVASNYESKVIGQPKLRQIVSKESGLWQFICDKGLVKKDGDINKDMEKYMYKCEYMDGCGNTINYWKRSKFTHHYFYEYFIIESALKDESELEQFLLSNIKVEG